MFCAFFSCFVQNRMRQMVKTSHDSIFKSFATRLSQIIHIPCSRRVRQRQDQFVQLCGTISNRCCSLAKLKLGFFFLLVELFKDKSYSWIVTKIFNGWQQCSCSHKKLLLLNYNHPGVACIMESSKKKYTTTHIFTSNFKWIYNSLLGEKCSYVAPNHVQRCELQYLTNTDSAMNTKQSNVRILAQIFL